MSIIIPGAINTGAHSPAEQSAKRARDRVSPAVGEFAIGECARLRDLNKELAQALQCASEALGTALDMSQKHDPSTGYYRAVDPLKLSIAIRLAFSKSRWALAKAAL